MKRSSLLLIGLVFILAGCGSSHKPVYSGHEESTEGVPGFVNGKKVSPHVKLGQSYSVDGETYVPRHQPDYVEEGMASWYGPGFHGGKTANGEQFDTADLTAAHRTLPMPSIVKVTMVSTGKTAYVRINDRGPFARSRIIDLSRAAADKIGLLRAGVAKVKVEYLKPESERFAQLLAQGRDPKSIDVASEVLDYTAKNRVMMAQNEPADIAPAEASEKESSWSDVSPVSSAEAAEPPSTIAKAAPVASVTSEDLDNSASPQSEQTEAVMKADADEEDENSPFSVVDQEKVATAPREELAMAEPASDAKQSASVQSSKSKQPGYFIQLGAFLRMDNARKTVEKYAAIAKAEIMQKANAKGQQLYHVRIGPFASLQAGEAELIKVKAAGGEEARVIHE